MLAGQRITCRSQAGARPRCWVPPPRCAFKMAATSRAAAQPQPSTDPAAADDYNKRWRDIWEREELGGATPGFDKGSSSPQLLALLSSGQLSAHGARVLVPGRGYDVFAFAAAGAAAAVGLDFCPRAVAAAEAQRDLELAQQPAAAAACELVAADFFAYQPVQPFELGYDYTFLCALHPDMRAQWAATWARLLAPGGELLTMVYPVDPSLRQDGPPWPVTPELYSQLLLSAGFDLVSLAPVPAELSHASRAGREWLGRWRRRGGADAHN